MFSSHRASLSKNSILPADEFLGTDLGVSVTYTKFQPICHQLFPRSDDWKSILLDTQLMGTWEATLHASAIERCDHEAEIVYSDLRTYEILGLDFEV